MFSSELYLNCPRRMQVYTCTLYVGHGTLTPYIHIKIKPKPPSTLRKSKSHPRVNFYIELEPEREPKLRK